MLTIRVPATSANLGAGFDCLGLALELRNEVRLAPAGGRGVRYRVEGFGAAEVAERPEENLFDRALRETTRRLRARLPPLAVHMVNRIPWRRGLGSSAAAAVAGVHAAAALAGRTLAPEEALDLALPLEGHPDNLAPAIAGGFTVATVAAGRAHLVRLAPPPLLAVALVPAFEVSTAAARRLLPRRVPLGDAVHNLGRAALWVAAVAGRRTDLLAAAAEDRLHEPYRARLVPGLDALREAAREAGGFAFLSGSGPTVLALARAAQADALRGALAAAWKRHGHGAVELHVLALARAGTQLRGRL